MPSIPYQKIGTLAFMPRQGGFDPSVVQSTTFTQLDGTDKVGFTAPGAIEGLAAGSSNFTARVDFTDGGHCNYNFSVDCIAPQPPPTTVPVSVPFVITVST